MLLRLDKMLAHLGYGSRKDVKQLIIYYYERLKKQILIPLMAKSALSANKKEALITEYGGIDKFNILLKCLLFSI